MSTSCNDNNDNDTGGIQPHDFWISSSKSRNRNLIIDNVISNQSEKTINLLNNNILLGGDDSSSSSSTVVVDRELLFIPKSSLSSSSSSIEQQQLPNDYYTSRAQHYYDVYNNQHQKKNNKISSSCNNSINNNNNNKNQPKKLRIIHVWSPYAVQKPKQQKRQQTSTTTDDSSSSNNNTTFNDIIDNNNIDMDMDMDDDIFFPLNQAQNVTWESIYRAQQYAAATTKASLSSIVEVQIYCAIFESDLKLIQSITNPPLCQPSNTIILHRSTATEYPNLKILLHHHKNNKDNDDNDDDDVQQNNNETNQKSYHSPPSSFSPQLPFVQDIFDGLLQKVYYDNKNNDNSNGDDNSDNNDNKQHYKDYIMLTNSDIALVEPFYVLAATTILKYQFLLDAFSVNRRTISKSYNPNTGQGNHDDIVSSMLQNKKKKKKTTTTSSNNHKTGFLGSRNYRERLYNSLSSSPQRGGGKFGYGDDVSPLLSSTSASSTTANQTQAQTHTYLPWTAQNLSYLENTELIYYENHPGHDCFFVTRALLESITLGNLFLGYPPWAGIFQGILKEYMATSYIMLDSTYGWTYHLGNDQSWNQAVKTTEAADAILQQKKKKKQQQQQQNNSCQQRQKSGGTVVGDGDDDTMKNGGEQGGHGGEDGDGRGGGSGGGGKQRIGLRFNNGGGQSLREKVAASKNNNVRYGDCAALNNFLNKANSRTMDNINNSLRKKHNNNNDNIRKKSQSPPKEFRHELSRKCRFPPNTVVVEEIIDGGDDERSQQQQLPLPQNEHWIQNAENCIDLFRNYNNNIPSDHHENDDTILTTDNTNQQQPQQDMVIIPNFVLDKQRYFAGLVAREEASASKRRR